MTRPTLLASVVAVTLGGALLWLLLASPAGPQWGTASVHGLLAAQLDRAASAPLYDVLAGLFALLPLGEVGTRLSILGALLGVATCAGVIAAVRALSPKDPLAGVVGVALLVLAPPVRAAFAVADPSALAACGIVWTVAACAAQAREASNRSLLVALIAVTSVVGSAPYLGAAVAALAAAWIARTTTRRDLAVGAAVIFVVIVALWIDTVGHLPLLEADLAALVGATGHGAAAVVIGAGLLGAAFAAVTGLASARWLVVTIALAFSFALVVDQAATPVLSLLAIGASLLPCAIVRAVDADARRDLVALGAGVPLVAMAVITGATFAVADPRDAPAHLAADLLDAQPPGPGVFVTTSETRWAALAYAQGVAGVRPDYVIVAPLPASKADGVVADALRAKSIAASDAPVFGRLDPTRTLARGRSFELRGEPVDIATPPPRVAQYASRIGESEAVLLAVARASFEAEHGRLDAAARAAGLTNRFRAADLAMLATAQLARERPPMFAFVPAFEPVGPWLLDLFGDDLAWVAGLPPVLLDDGAAKSRQLHTHWRSLMSGLITAEDPSIVALGPLAVAATKRLLESYTPLEAPPPK